jgi:hypothetical protein
VGERAQRRGQHGIEAPGPADKDQARDALRGRRRHPHRDRRADRVAEHGGALDAEPVEQLEEQGGVRP